MFAAVLSCVSFAAPPSFESIKSSHTPSDYLILDRNQQPLQRIRIDNTVRRSEWIELDDISPALIDAVLASEDKRFFDHGGVDLRAAASAAFSNLSSGKTQRGASSISMQVAAGFDAALKRGSDGRTLTQKFDQAQAAWDLERSWSKQQILETYLNQIYFRGELQGIGAASEQLFGKAPHGLNAVESAILAALIRAPQAARSVVERRACELLQSMARGDECARVAFAMDKWGSASVLRSESENLAPHVVKFLLPSPLVGEGLGERGKLASGTNVALQSNVPLSPTLSLRGRGGQTTLDRDLQIAARDAINKHLQALSGRNAHDAAVVVIDNVSGEVLAYVGSSGRLSQAGEVDAARASRQAGSTLKPFIYALAFERNILTPATLLDDSPFSVDVGGGAYTPQNYANDYVGPVSVRTALASSLNVPAIRALTLVGVAPTHALLKRAGLTTLVNDPDHYGFSLALGSADVSLVELTNAYRAIANGGINSPIKFDVCDASCRSGLPRKAPNAQHSRQAAPTVENANVAKRLFSDSTAWLITHILADRGARYLTFGFDNPLALSHWAAVKTGTSKDMRDNWTIGFNTRVTVGVWVGNASGQPMHNVTGISGAGPIWADVMEAAASKYGAGRLSAMPANVVKRRIQFAATDVPLSPCGRGARGEGEAKLGCDLGASNAQPPLPNPLPQGEREQRPVAARVALEPGRDEYFIRGSEPQSTTITAREASSAGARIVSPTDGSIIAIDPDISEANQRISLKSGDAQQANCWEVGGQSLGCSETPLSWSPTSSSSDVVGIRLLDRNGEERDRIAITIRGGVKRIKSL